MEKKTEGKLTEEIEEGAKSARENDGVLFKVKRDTHEGWAGETG